MIDSLCNHSILPSPVAYFVLYGLVEQRQGGSTPPSKKPLNRRSRAPTDFADLKCLGMDVILEKRSHERESKTSRRHKSTWSDQWQKSLQLIGRSIRWKPCVRNQRSVLN